ncbi:hypothetical protein [Bacteroides sp. 519]|uniref:hypothetical protein n=1 Tax=Bacteroides sp. 519 TaxID=2302937 RepID=UPI0013CFBEB0|nr:hypothetical protein [Bacteroides sp. 519]NDV56706.1 hypothetical protein [Bacteroides sp. 519]
MNYLLGLMPHSFALILSDVQIKDSQIETYDLLGEIIAAMPSSGKELKGVGNDFFVVFNDNKIETYNAFCKKIASLPASDKVVVRVANDYFSVKRIWRIKRYDRSCNILKIDQ